MAGLCTHLLSQGMAPFPPTTDISYAGIKGTVRDVQSLETLPGATVFLMQNDSILQGTLTDIDGHYEFTRVPSGTYQLKVKYISYEEKIIEVKVDTKNGASDLMVMNIEETPVYPCICEEKIIPLPPYWLSGNTYSGWKAEYILIQSLGF